MNGTTTAEEGTITRLKTPVNEIKVKSLELDNLKSNKEIMLSISTPDRRSVIRRIGRSLSHANRDDKNKNEFRNYLDNECTETARLDGTSNFFELDDYAGLEILEVRPIVIDDISSNNKRRQRGVKKSKSCGTLSKSSSDNNNKTDEKSNNCKKSRGSIGPSNSFRESAKEARRAVLSAVGKSLRRMSSRDLLRSSGTSNTAAADTNNSNNLKSDTEVTKSPTVEDQHPTTITTTTITPKSSSDENSSSTCTATTSTINKLETPAPILKTRQKQASSPPVLCVPDISTIQQEEASSPTITRPELSTSLSVPSLDDDSVVEPMYGVHQALPQVSEDSALQGSPMVKVSRTLSVDSIFISGGPPRVSRTVSSQKLQRPVTTTRDSPPASFQQNNEAQTSGDGLQLPEFGMSMTSLDYVSPSINNEDIKANKAEPKRKFLRLARGVNRNKSHLSHLSTDTAMSVEDIFKEQNEGNTTNERKLRLGTIGRRVRRCKTSESDIAEIAALQQQQASTNGGTRSSFRVKIQKKNNFARGTARRPSGTLSVTELASLFEASRSITGGGQSIVSKNSNGGNGGQQQKTSHDSSKSSLGLGGNSSPRRPLRRLSNRRPAPPRLDELERSLAVKANDLEERKSMLTRLGQTIRKSCSMRAADDATASFESSDAEGDNNNKAKDDSNNKQNDNNNKQATRNLELDAFRREESNQVPTYIVVVEDMQSTTVSTIGKKSIDDTNNNTSSNEFSIPAYVFINLADNIDCDSSIGEMSSIIIDNNLDNEDDDEESLEEDLDRQS